MDENGLRGSRDLFWVDESGLRGSRELWQVVVSGLEVALGPGEAGSSAFIAVLRSNEPGLSGMGVRKLADICGLIMLETGSAGHVDMVW